MGVERVAGQAQVKEALNLAKAESAIAVEEAKDRFEDSESMVNPAAMARAADRLNRFRPLTERSGSKKSESESTESSAKVEGIGDEEGAGEDLAQNYHRRNDELDPAELRKLADELKNSTDPDEVVARVLKSFPDPTLADEALEYLQQVIQGNAKKVIADAKHYINVKYRREIIAGQNIHEAAKKKVYKKKLRATSSQLRDLYREITLNPTKEHNVLFAELSGQYSFEELTHVASFLLKGMDFDLKAQGPSIQPQHLIRLVSEMRKLQSIVWVYRFFQSRERLIKKLYEEYGCEEEIPPTFEELSKTFIEIVEERYPTVAKILAKAQKNGWDDDEEKIIIFTQFRDAIRALSPRLYRNIQHRQDLLMVILETLEELEEEESESI